MILFRMARRRFDDDFKAQAARLVLDDGRSVGAVRLDPRCDQNLFRVRRHLLRAVHHRLPTGGRAPITTRRGDAEKCQTTLRCRSVGPWLGVARGDHRASSGKLAAQHARWVHGGMNIKVVACWVIDDGDGLIGH